MAAMEDLLARPGPGALVLRGEPGIGKTTIFQAGVERARAGGWWVLGAAPSDGESHLPFAAAQDLLRGFPSGVFDQLPRPQRQALRVVLLVEDAPSSGLDRRTVGTALESAIRLLAGQQPVLVAIDDVQWLDPASRDVITFAQRRLDEGRLRWLLAERRPMDQVLPLGMDQVPPLGLDRAPARAMRIVEVGPMSAGTLFHVLREGLACTIPRPRLVRIATWSGGNPLFALELARRMLDDPDTAPDLSAAPSVEGLMGDRLARLPVGVRGSLLIIALAGHLSAERLDAVRIRLDWQSDPSALSSGLVVETEDGVRLAHPVLAAQTIANAGPSDRRRVHAALALDESDGVRRARHQALGVLGPDLDAASAAEAGAIEAETRGAPEAALELFEHACRLTPPGGSGALQTRYFHVGDLAYRLGDRARAAQALRVSADGPDQATTARSLVRLARLAGDQPDIDPLVLPRQARRAAAGNRLLLAEIALWLEGDPGEVRRHAAAARRLLGDDGPAALRARAHAAEAIAAIESGRPLARRFLDRAVDLEAGNTGPNVARSAAFAQAWWRVLDDDLDAARTAFWALRRQADVTGDEDSLPMIVAHLAHLEIRAGNWTGAQALAEEQAMLAERAGQPARAAFAHLQLGAIASLRGDAGVAETHFVMAESLGRSDRGPIRGLVAGRRGNLQLSRGDAAGAVAAFAAARQTLRDVGVDQPALTNWRGEEIEALTRMGRVDEAVALLERLELTRIGRGRLTDSVIYRSRALIAAARGDLDGAAALADEAIARIRNLGHPFELARSLHVGGVIQRRRGKKRLAATLLGEALQQMERLGAALWAAQVREDLRRVGLRPRASVGLTETELQVVRLAASGSTNRRIAEQSFMSPRTVEGILGRAYTKLGVGSRAELGRALIERDLGH